MNDNRTNRTLCDSSICTGCKACVNVCARNAVTVTDNIDSFTAEIVGQKCADCGLCAEVCPGLNTISLRENIFCKQGWASEDVRANSSSGGAAAAIISGFIRAGGYVASCMFKDGDFRFVITNDLSEAKNFAGSKYVKSDAHFVYREVKELLKRGEKVLFIGLPCQSAAVQNFCRDLPRQSETADNVSDGANLYTADLICHGTPSKEILRMYLAEQGIELAKATEVKFREGNVFGLIVDGKRLAPPNTLDYYTYAFLKSEDYLESCYNCRYAAAKRVSDITLGDAWGQMADTDTKGVSLILCQSEKGKNLVEQALSGDASGTEDAQSGLMLFEVDLEKAIAANPQLKHPSEKTEKRDTYITRIKEGGSVTAATKKTFPAFCLKSSVKSIFGGEK